MRSKSFHAVVMAAAVVLAVQVAQAHPGHGAGGGLSAGLAHPFSGIDHIMAMLAVGMLATQIGGKMLWGLPATFVALMVGGGLMNFAGVPVPWVEQGIMASVLILGLMVAAAGRFPTSASLSLVGFFAIFHGFAHAAEMHKGTSAVGYALGFIIATATLHAIGIALGLAAGKLASKQLVRLAGAAIAACGLLLFMHVIQA
jgi:urease accessory protein